MQRPTRYRAVVLTSWDRTYRIQLSDCIITPQTNSLHYIDTPAVHAQQCGSI